MGQNPAEEIYFRHLLTTIEALPTLPVVALEGMKRALKPSGTLKELLGIVEIDPALTSKVLKVANTPHYGKPGTITSLGEAASRLGYPVLRSIVLSVSAMEFFSDWKEDYGLDLGELWKHSIGAAVWSRHLSGAVNPALDPEEAFISGLLHDIGKVIFCNSLKGRYREVLQHAAKRGLRLYQAERECLGCDHADVSNWVLGNWKIPSLYSRVIFHHHHPARSLFEQERELCLCRIVKLADQLCYCYGTGNGGDPVPRQEPSQTLLKELGIPIGALETANPKIRFDVEELLERLDWMPISRTAYLPTLMDAHRALGELGQVRETQHQTLAQRERELRGINVLGLSLQGSDSIPDTLRILAESLVSAFPFEESICTVYLNSKWELNCHARKVGDASHCQSTLQEQPRRPESYDARDSEGPLLFADLIGKDGPLGHMQVRPSRQDAVLMDTVGLLLASCAKMAAEAIDRVHSLEQIQRLTENLKRSLTQIDEERERVELERNLRETILTGLPVGILLLDAKGRTLYYNPAAAKSHLSGALQIGKPLSEVFPDPMLEKGIQTVLQSGRAYRSESRFEDRATGTETEYQWSLLPVSSPPGGDATLLFTINDVTEERILQQGLLESARMASIGELAAGTAHNLRSPLGAVKGILELVVDEMESGNITCYSSETQPPQPTSSVKEQLDIVLRSLGKSFSILDDLLQFARRPDRPPEMIRLSELLEGTETLLGELLRERGIRVEKDLDANEVFGRKADLMQVFLNLYSNAYKAMPKGGMIRVHSRRPPPQQGGTARTEVSFADTGCGIPSDSLDKIFDPFYTTSDRVEGTGLGLSLTRKIVKEHGGALEVSSKVGKGTVFLLTLPAYPSAPAGGSVREA